MKVSSILSTVALASIALGAVTVNPRADASDEAQVGELISNLKADVLKSLDEREAKLRKRGEEPTCTAKNIVFRRE